MTGRTVLLFAHECDPHHRPASTMAAQRPAGFARHLANFGWRPVVICCDAARRESISADDLPSVRDEVRAALREAPAGEPLVLAVPSLVADGFVDRAWKRARRSTSSAAVPLRRALTAAKWWSGDYSRSWQPAARAAAEEVAAQMEVDACIGMHSPDAGLFLARWFHRRHGVPWIADFRDPVEEGFRGLGREAYLRVARGIVRTAARLVAVTPAWAERDEALLGRPAVSIPNGFEPSEFAGPPPAPRPPGSPFTLLYAGSVTGEQDTDLPSRALRRLEDRTPGGLAGRLLLVCRGAGEARWRASLESAGVLHLADVAGREPREAVLRRMRSADLLVLLSVSPDRSVPPSRSRGVYPGKVFEYLGAGRPILSLPGDGGVLDALIMRTGAGTIGADEESVAADLEEALRRHEAGDPVEYGPDPDVVASYARPALAGRLARVLDEVAGVPQGDR